MDITIARMDGMSVPRTIVAGFPNEGCDSDERRAMRHARARRAARVCAREWPARATAHGGGQGRGDARRSSCRTPTEIGS